MKKLLALLFSSLTILMIVFVLSLFTKTNGQTKNYFTNQPNTSTAAIANIDDTLPKVSQAGNGQAKTGSASAAGTGKADLKMADGKGELVNENAASADTGYSGVDYGFSDEMYPYRAMLTDQQQKVYDQVYENAENLNTSFTLVEILSKDGINNVMTAVFNDHPELFWLDTSYSYGYTTKGTVVSLTLVLNETAKNISSSRQKFQAAVTKIIAEASKVSGDVEKEKVVYKELMNRVVYDENSVLNQSAYSAMVNGSSVCAGYSRAFQYILQQLNIPCYFCSGYANGGYHAWNIVKVDGKFYNADLSWDDELGDISNSYSYVYFNISDKIISSDHTRREMSVNLPRCD